MLDGEASKAQSCAEKLKDNRIVETRERKDERPISGKAAGQLGAPLAKPVSCASWQGEASGIAIF